MVYQGNDKYIFISYAHADSDRVLPVAEALQNNGCRGWFDSGIEAGTEWPEYIEERLANSEVVLVFMTPAAVESRNCRNEINFALELKKEILVVYLEETTLLKGMRLQLNSTQSMFRAHHRSEETFLKALLEARVLQRCKEGYVQTAPTRPAAPKAGYGYQPAATSKKKPILLIALAGLLVAGAVVAGIFLLEGKKTPAGGTETTAQPAPTEVVMSDKLLDFTLEIEGKVYKLPFTYQQLVDDGWTISSSNYSDDYMIRADQYELIPVVKNGKKIEIYSYNLSGNARAVKDCLVGGIQWELGKGVDVKMAKGITLNSTLEEMQEAFGAPNDWSENNNYASLTYSVNDSIYNSVRITYYLEEADKKYSYASVRNFVSTDADITETNPEAPDYLAQYVAPTALGTDFESGIVQIQGELYHLPAPVSAFTDNGWRVTQKPSNVRSGSVDTIRLERDGVSTYVDIINLAEYQTIPENCAVYGFSIEAEDNVAVQLPNGISMESTKEEVESWVTEKFYHYAGSYELCWTYYNYTDREFDLDIYMDAETLKISRIRIANR